MSTLIEKVALYLQHAILISRTREQNKKGSKMQVKTIIRTVDGEKFEDVQEIAEGFTREEVEKELEEDRRDFQNALMDNQNNYYTMYIDNGTVVFNLNHIVSVRTEIIED